jgi:hypothetical protein
MVTPLTGFCKRCGTNLNLTPEEWRKDASK